MYNNSSGNYNTSVGYWALNQNYDSWYNVAIGTFAGSSTHGWNNTFIGANTNVTSSDIYNGTALGNNALLTASNQVRIGNNYVTSIGGFANWTNVSDGRVKKNIKENVPGLAFINKLKPVTYNLDIDAFDKIAWRPSVNDKNGQPFAQKNSLQEIDARNAKQQILYTGFVAQDVEKAAKELKYDFSGVDAAKNDRDLYGLRYSDFVVPLVKAVQELSVKNDSLQKRSDILQMQNDDFEKRIEKLESIINNKSSAAGGNTPGISISSSSLEQNVPNPFANSTTIRYTLPQRYYSAKLIITDKSGTTLKEVNLNGHGKGNVKFNNSTLSAGSYQYSLIVNGKLIATKQMIFLK
ncbi:MAG TPA: tail fiber domain-containing protein [Parafilimonas sp.]|nr:tail fiber domain-containing protein [Parafilimonas sp.]